MTASSRGPGQGSTFKFSMKMESIVHRAHRIVNNNSAGRSSSSTSGKKKGKQERDLKGSSAKRCKLIDTSSNKLIADISSDMDVLADTKRDEK